MSTSRVPDATITKQASQKLTNRGIRSPGHVQVQARNGDVTLVGSVQHAHQKRTASQIVGAISGVRRVIDQLIVKPVVKQ